MTVGMGVGVVVNGGKNRIVQTRTVRKDGWTEARREGFLLALSMTANVTTSAAGVGITSSGAHALRRREPGFAAAWSEALASGYDRLEEALLMVTLAGLRDDLPVTGLADARADETAVVVGAEAGNDRLAPAEPGRDETVGRPSLVGGVPESGPQSEPQSEPQSGLQSGLQSRLQSGLLSGPGPGPGLAIVALPRVQAVHVGLAMLARFRAAQAGGGGKRLRHRRATVAETNASIAKKLDSLAQRLRASSSEGEP